MSLIPVSDEHMDRARVQAAAALLRRPVSGLTFDYGRDEWFVDDGPERITARVLDDVAWPIAERIAVGEFAATARRRGRVGGRARDGCMSAPWFDAYFEARLAFADRPDARISTWTDGGGTIGVGIRERIDDEVLAGTYMVWDQHPLACASYADAARDKWRHELEKRERWEPFDIDRLADFVWRNGSTQFPLRLNINRSWGSELRMRLDRGVVTLSPEADMRVRRAIHSSHQVLTETLR